MVATALARLIAASAILAPIAAAPQEDEPPKAEKQDFPTDLSKWVVVEGPTSIARWESFFYDQNRWVVSPDGGKPLVRRAPRRDPAPALPAAIRGPVKELIESECTHGGRACFTRLEDGWAVGLDGGEFGGGLWWISTDGKRRYRILGAQTQILLQAKGGVVALGGLQNSGHVRRLVKGEDGRWEAKVLVKELGEAPGIALIEADGSVLIASGRQIVRVSPLGKVETLVERQRWVVAAPTSLVITARGDILLGGRHCVTRIVKDQAAYRVELLLPEREADPRKPK